MDKLTAFKITHDEVFERMSEAEKAEHISSSCELCESENAALIKGGDTVTTYTEDEVKGLVAKAVQEATAPLEAKLDEVRTSKEQEAVDSKIAALEAAHAEELDALKAELDTANVKATEVQSNYDGLVDFLESEKAAAEKAAAVEAKKASRLDAVKEVASFDDAYLEANIDRWANMDDEDFEALTASWDAVKQTVAPGVNSGKELSSELPAESAMLNGSHKEVKGTARREILGLRNRGIDPRTLVV